MSRASRLNPTELSVVGIDIGKDVFHIIGFDPSGTIVLRRKQNENRPSTSSAENTAKDSGTASHLAASA